jgi:regulatory protein
MPKITRITTQQKNKSRFNIFLDEKYAFSVNEDTLVSHMLRKGIELDEATIAMLKTQDETNKLYGLSINLLSYRMRSEKEIVDYLKKKEAEAEQIEEVISRLQQEGYINDQEFANSFVQSRMTSSSKGPLLLKKELREKGVVASKADQALAIYTTEIQFEKVHKFVEKKMKSNQKKSLQQQLQTLQGTLIQKGFTAEVIQDALRDAKQDFRDEEKEQTAVVHQGLKLLQKYKGKAEGFELKQKIKAALYRKGFQFDQIEAFLDEHLAEE